MSNKPTNEELQKKLIAEVETTERLLSTIATLKQLIKDQKTNLEKIELYETVLNKAKASIDALIQAHYPEDNMDFGIRAIAIPTEAHTPDWQERAFCYLLTLLRESEQGKGGW
jgi:hypothetical protein